MAAAPQLQCHSDRESHVRIPAIVKVIPVVITNVKVIGVVPVCCPGLRVRIHEQKRKATVREAWIPHVDAGEAVHPEPVSDPEIEIELGFRNVVTAVASTLRPGAMIAIPVLRTILLPGTMALPAAALCPSPLMLPRDCLLPRALRLLLLSLLGVLLLGLLLLSLLGALLLGLLLLSLLGALLLGLLLLSLLGVLLLGLLLLSLLDALLLGLLLLSLLGALLLGLLLLSLLGMLLLGLLLLSLLDALLLGLLLLSLLDALLLGLLLLSLLGVLLLGLLLLSLLGVLLLGLLLLGLLGMLLLRLLRLCGLLFRLGLFFVLLFVLCVHRNNGREKQKQGSDTGRSNKSHSNVLLQGRYVVCTQTASAPLAMFRGPSRPSPLPGRCGVTSTKACVGAEFVS